MNTETNKQYPVMPLKNTVLFPQQVIPIYVGREKSLKLIEDLPDDNKYLVVVAQQDGSIEDPKEDDLYSYGTLALVLKTFDMPDNSKSAIVQGVDRVKILKFNQGDSYFMADIERIQESITTPDVQIEALAKNLKSNTHNEEGQNALDQNTPDQERLDYLTTTTMSNHEEGVEDQKLDLSSEGDRDLDTKHNGLEGMFMRLDLLWLSFEFSNFCIYFFLSFYGSLF